MTSNTIYIVAFSGSLKCPRKIHFNTQCPAPQIPTLLVNLWNVNDDHCFSIDATGVWTFFVTLMWGGVGNIIK